MIKHSVICDFCKTEICSTVFNGSGQEHVFDENGDVASPVLGPFKPTFKAPWTGQPWYPVELDVCANCKGKFSNDTSMESRLRPRKLPIKHRELGTVILIQVNGKTEGKLEIAEHWTKQMIEENSMAIAEIEPAQVNTCVIVPGKLINIITKE